MNAAVIFDVDGVLVRTDEAHYQSWQSVMDDAGIAFDRTVNRHLLGVSRRASLAIILEAAGQTLDEQTQAGLAEEKNRRFQAFLQTLTPHDVLPGALELIQALRLHSIPIAAGSSSRNARYILERTELLPLFNALVDGNDIQRSKPDPEVFLKCAGLLDVPPSVCVVVEDAPAGIEAARAAGMRVIAVGDGAHTPSPDRIFSDLKSVTVDMLLELARNPSSRL